jgi:dolichyl-phosphate-mannose--protein O-mannosyl transferase
MILFSFISFVMTRVFFSHFYIKKLAFSFPKSSKISDFYTRKTEKISNFCGKKKLLEKETLIMTH